MVRLLWRQSSLATVWAPSPRNRLETPPRADYSRDRGLAPHGSAPLHGVQPLAPPVKFQLARWRLGTRRSLMKPLGTSSGSLPMAFTAPGASAPENDWVNRMFVRARARRPFSISHTPFRVNPVTTWVFG